VPLLARPFRADQRVNSFLEFLDGFISPWRPMPFPEFRDALERTLDALVWLSHHSLARASGI
jgi:hypothetical protein